MSSDFLLCCWARDKVQAKPMAKKKEKDPHAVYLGRLGGKARRRNLTREQRGQIARKAAQARWAKKKTPESPSDR
jgi:hypothetical protein